MGKVVLVGSQKNDIGKTSVCIKTGIGLSDRGSRVLLVDLSSGKIKMSEYLDVDEDIIYDVKDVLDLICSLEQAVIEINGNLSLIPCPRVPNKLKNIKVNEFRNLIFEAKKTFDCIIIDVDKISLSYIDFDIVDNIITINNNDFSCVKELNIDKSIAERFNVNLINPILNKYNKISGKKGTMMNHSDIQKMTNMDINIVIDENIEYSDIDYDFLFNNEDNSFNKGIQILISEM